MVIASGVIDRRPFGPLSESSSSFFSEDLVPTERQVGFWKSESMVDQKGSKSVFASPLEKIHPTVVNPAGGLDHPGDQAFKGQLDVLDHSNVVGQENNTSNLGSISWGDVFSSSRSRLGMSAAFLEPAAANQRVHDYGNGSSDSSFSEMFSSKLRLIANGAPGQSVDAKSSSWSADEPLGSMREVEAQTIGDLLPDDDDLISGVMDGFEHTGLPNHDDADEDIFCTGGGMELEDDSKNGNKYQEVSVKSELSWERSINKHPTRDLIVKNINTSIEDSELRLLFQQYGDIQTLHTSYKNHGFVTVSYYDIRAAQNAMRALHNKALGQMNLDVHFSIPEEKGANVDPNNGVLAISISDSSISNDDLLQILSVYGDVKEIWKASACCNKKLVEFFDVRVAEVALTDLNKGDISCQKIKVEHSFYGGARSCLTEHCSREWNQDAVTHQLKNSSPGTIGKLGPKSWDKGTVHDLYPPAGLQFNKSLHGFSMNDPQKLSSPIRIESTRQQNNQATFDEPRGSLGHANIGGGLQSFHPHSLPECHDGICNISSMALSVRNTNFRLMEGGHINNHNISASGLHGHSSDQNEAFGFTGVGSCPLHCHDYTWNTPNGGFLQRPSAPVLWSNFQHPMHMHGGFASMHTFHSRSHESVRLSGSPQQYPSDLSALGPTRGNYRETMFSPVSAGFPSPQQFFHATNGRNPMLRVSTSYDATNDRIRSRRHDGNFVQSEENKKQFELDIDRIAKGEDLRTTLMIKNIPNKYNCKLLLAVIDENHRGTYDFIYLPIDFKNKCNVGYAFINMTDPQHIIPFYKTFNGKKWEKFNSEKVASLAYARIQGRSALISHFQNSSLMNEEKWCRPILFHKDGPNAGDQEPFPVGNNVQSRSGRNRPVISSDTRDGSPSTSPN
ncbi:hypothetical protein QOZ80_5BG0457330 [Eleusine coracana subsp. coracana]|nr:hypothetical protein QOZ80_5BG0457330 [Eleusine coracana subsp. coracana]